jgi:hypothetical protein
VLVAKKDFYSVWTYKSPEGDKDLSLPNLEVVNLLKSLKSSGYVKETFNWYVRNKYVEEGRSVSVYRCVYLYVHEWRMEKWDVINNIHNK